jgi:hypothetical protein
MAEFRPMAPVVTAAPTVTVDNTLAVGGHRFQLEVVDAAGLRSQPHQAIVQVQRIIVDPGPIITGPGPIVVDPGPIVFNPTPPIRPGGGVIRSPRPRARRKKGGS